MRYLCIDPAFAPKIFSTGFAETFCKTGVGTAVLPLGSAKIWDFWNRQKWMHSKARLMATTLNAVFGFSKCLHRVSKNDTVIVYETNSIISPVFDAAFHRAVKARGATLVSLLADSWPDSFPYVKKAFLRRAALADIVACVTPQLAARISEVVRDKPVIVLEEPIDTNAFDDVVSLPANQEGPLVVWSGPPGKAASEVSETLSALGALPSIPPFRLRVVTGAANPNLRLCQPYEWRPYFGLPYREQFSGAEIAFACYGRRAWDGCKGNYKVKTYMAAGCAVVTDDFGYSQNLIHSGENGLLVADASMRAAAIVHLLQEPELRLHLRQAAQASCRKRFGYEALASNWNKTLKDVGLEG